MAALEHWATGGVPGWLQQQAEGDVEGAEKTEPAKVEMEVSREEGAAQEGRPLVSTLLVAPRLHPFNAAKFDSFARNLAIALKQTPIMDRIEVEVRTRTRARVCFFSR